MRFISLFILLCLFLNVNGNVDAVTPKYLPNTLILKVKPEYSSYCGKSAITHPEIQKLLSSIGIESLRKEYPNHSAPKKTHNDQGIKLVDLSLIYLFKYSISQDPKVIGSKMMSSGFFEYSEPFFLHQELFSPNDPEIGSQYHLTNIKAYEAWDIAQGDTNIVMAITDTGIELTHGDISGNIKYNYLDPINGIDDDGDGYIDNYYGWDMGDNDSDPSLDGNGHGQYVSGTAGATTNNGVQTAGVGYKSKILPIKVLNASGYLVGTYNAIVYAADHGAKIINCSWGSVDSWSQYGQDIITYAAITKNCLVVCSAGNDNNEGLFYPASFDFAMSVAASNISDNKWNYLWNKGSNYNEHVDISAPGHNIYTLNFGNGTRTGLAGTSFAAPIVSGAAAVAWSMYPSYTGLQIGELLKATADSMELIPGNESYEGKLGEGRLNMYRSVTESGFPGLYMHDFNFTGNNQNKLAPGDTITASGVILNYLAPSSIGTTVRITTNSPYIKMVDSIITIGTIPTDGSLNISSTPFKFVVLPGMSASEAVGFVFTMTDGTYNSKRYTEEVFNIDFVDIEVNKLGTSVGASGKLGYNILQQQTEGLGVTYNGSSSILYHLGLMVADNASQVSYVLDGDFDTQDVLQVHDPGVESDYDVYTGYNDQPADSSLDISINQKTLAWSETKRDKFVLVECQVFNNSATTYSNLHLGIYADWDIGAAGANQANFDATTNTAYVSESGGVFGGIHLLDYSTLHHYAYNNDGTGGSASIYDGYDENEQYTHLTGGNSRTASDVTDASHLIGNGPYTLAAGDSMFFTFAIVVGDSLTDIQNAALEADSAYHEIREIDITMSNSSDPSCNGFCDGNITIEASGGIGSYTYLWNDPMSQITATASGLCAGVYQCTVTDSLGTSSTITNVVLTNPADIPVILGNDSTVCGNDSLMLDAGNPGQKYLWNTGDTTQTIYAKTAGQYIVTVTNVIGCQGTDTIPIFAANNPVVSLGNDTTSCKSTSVTFDAGNPGLNYLWSSGTISQTESFGVTGTHWVEVTNFSNCSTRDSIVLTVSSLNAVDLGDDINACDSYSGTLDAGNPGYSYLWSTGETGQSIAISTAEKFYVDVDDNGECIVSDTILVNIEPTPNINFGADTTVCRSSNFILDAGLGSSYLWNNGLTTQTIPTYIEGQYIVIVGSNCTDTDTINVSFHDDPHVWYKSSFETERNTVEGDVALSFGLPEGGIYSGAGVTGNIFNTVSAGNGLHKIDYTFTEAVNGCSAVTWVTMDVNPTVSAFKINNNDILIFPNPFDDYINVEFGSVAELNNVHILLYDNQGKLLQSKTIQNPNSGLQHVVETESYTHGVYHLVVRGEGFYKDFKLVK